jgi:hypothetical protein
MSIKNIRSSYKLYKETCSSKPVDVKTYINYASAFNKFIMFKVVQGEEVVLPHRLGSLYIVGKKQKVKFDEKGKIVGLAPDWVKTKQMWEENPETKKEKKVLYHTNPETEGYRYKIFWSKKSMIALNRMLYALRFTRTNKRNVSTLIKEGKQYKTR